MGVRSNRLFDRARVRIPGGVNSPARAFGPVGGNPLFIDRAKGARVFDADGDVFIDYVASWGPLILGHAHPGVMAAIKRACERGYQLWRADRNGDSTRRTGSRDGSRRRDGSDGQFRY